MRNLQLKNSTPVCGDFWGNGAVYHCFAEMPDEENRQYSPKMAELEADRAGKMRLKIARTMYRCWGWDEQQQAWTWETPECRALYRWLQRMKDRGITVALNTGWCCPGDVNGTSWNDNPPWADRDNWEKSLQGYADWVSETVRQLVVLRGFTNIKILVLFTEPRKPGGVMPATSEPFSETNREAMFRLWNDCVNAAAAALRRDGLRDKVLLMGPNCGHLISAQMLKWTAENATEIDLYSSHTYQWNEEPEDCDPNEDGGELTTIAIKTPGGRFCQKVTLKPFTTYKVTVCCRVVKRDPLHLSGNILFGAFDRSQEYISGGGDPTNRLTRHSVKMLDPSKMSTEFCSYSFTFQTQGEVAAKVGVFSDVKHESYLIVNSLSLTEQPDGLELLQNGDFAQGPLNWDTFCTLGASDVYYDWRRWCQTGMQYLRPDQPFVFDEYNIGWNRDHSRNEHGANLALSIVAQMNAGVFANMLWTLFDQIWPNNHTTNGDNFFDGDHRWGLATNLNRSLVPHKSYYAFSMISKYTGGRGSKVYEGVGEKHLHLTMNELSDGNVTIIVVNNKAQGEKFKITLQKPLKARLFCHRFNPKTVVPNEKAEILPSSGEIKLNGTEFFDSIAPYGVTVYTSCNN